MLTVKKALVDVRDDAGVAVFDPVAKKP